MRSGNAFVVGSVVAAARDRRPSPGAAAIRKIRAEIAPSDWVAGEIERWYATGWSVQFRRGEDAVELVVARADEHGVEWAVQVAPARMPGALARALGKAASATPAEVYELARAAHAVLASDGRFTALRWRWGGFPTEKKSTPEPRPPPPTGRGPRRRLRRGRS